MLLRCKVGALQAAAPLRVAHRGAHRDHPENSIDAFAAAVRQGADVIEFDVVPVRGALVVAHSRRERGRDSPTLDEALAFFAGEGRDVGLHLDLKTGGAEAQLVEALGVHGLVERTVVSTCHVPTLRALRRRSPELQLAITYPRDRFGLGDRRPLAPLARTGLAALRAALPARIGGLLARAAADALALHHTVVSRAAVEAAHARGAPVIVWTVDDPDVLGAVVGAGVDAVVTNDLSIFEATLRR